jgi:pimeloyl-ACP methyl ester carboxylesterase
MMFLLKASLVVLATLYALAIACLGLFQRKLMYFPDSRLVSAARAGMTGAEEIHLPTSDGEKLVAWHVPAPEGRPLILYFHGNAGGLADRAPRFQSLLASGYGLFAVAFRGFCGSTGSPTQAGLMLDGEAAYDAARARGYSDKRIVVMGESLGTGVAAAIAANHDVAALVLDSPYSSTADVAAMRFPLAPVRWIIFDQFRSDLEISKVRDRKSVV